MSPGTIYVSKLTQANLVNPVVLVIFVFIRIFIDERHGDGFFGRLGNFLIVGICQAIEAFPLPRIKQWNNLARNRIDTGQVRAFPEIAAVTGKGQVAGSVGPTMLPGYDVLDVMRKGRTILRKQAIFTTVPGSGSDEYPPSPTPSLRGVGKLPAGL